MSNPSISEMRGLVKLREKRTFARSIQPADPVGRFMSVHANYDYGQDLLVWENALPMMEAPYVGNRYQQHRGLDAVADFDLTFRGKESEVIDFYAPAADIFIVSDKALEIIEGLDPDAVELRRATLKGNGFARPMNVIMPGRLIEAVDPDASDVTVHYKETVPGVSAIRVNFPSGVIFKKLSPEIHAFKDLDIKDWFWSRELLETAKACGVLGLYAKHPSGQSIYENLYL
ncbi:imm11 family protein [Caulobacter sp. DWR2-3-1b2]|uniref:imm11 family protein n=1 Tax=unclassified Caulobacter TaxID=2648921 RepID=UPI0019BF679E|nr:hypothetical protein [Caulobacter sp.]